VINEFLYEYLLIAAIVIIFLLERFFVTISFRNEMAALRKEFMELRSEFTKLAVLSQAVMMNMKFADADGNEQPGIKSKLKSTDTQVMISAKEMERLRDIEKLHMQQELIRVRKAIHPDTEIDESQENDNDIFFAGGFK
jgi:hypothetical protein